MRIFRPLEKFLRKKKLFKQKISHFLNSNVSYITIIFNFLKSFMLYASFRHVSQYKDKRQ